MPKADAPAGARFWFRDVTEPAGLGEFRQVNGEPHKPLLVDQMGAGVALLDHDTDGDLDAYLTNGSRIGGFPEGQEPRDALYVNRGDGTFDDGTEEAGLGDTRWTNGVAVADVDGDGWPELFLANYGPNVLYRNEGGRFVDVSDEAGVADPSWSTNGCFFDADLDGDLDLYVSNYVDFDPEYVPEDKQLCEYRGVMVAYGPRGLPRARDRYYVGDGEGRFTEASEAAGLVAEPGYGFQVLAFDYDEDGDTDLFVGNDSVPNHLWENDGRGVFRDVSGHSGAAVSLAGKPQACMGAAVGDYNEDGRLDLFVTNFAEDYHTLYRNDGRGFFTDVTLHVGLRTPTIASLGWSCGFVDFDSDGDEDLYAVNGHLYPQIDQFDFGTKYRQRNQLFENDGGRFVDVTAEAGPGFAPLRVGRGGATGDVDGDGDVDLLVGNLDDRPALLRNDSPRTGSWVHLRLVGTRCNRDAVGATVELRALGRLQKRAVGSNSGFSSASDPRLHFAVGDVRQVDEVVVRWPGGARERFGGLAVGREHRLVEGASAER